MTVSTLYDMTTTVTSVNPMTGTDLLNFVKKAGGMTKTDLAMATGTRLLRRLKPFTPRMGCL